MVKRLAALAVAGTFLLGACGGDGDDGDTAGGGSDGTEQTAGGEGLGGNGGGDGGNGETGGGGSAGGRAGYTDQMRSAYVRACTTGQGSSESECECAFDEISQNVPVLEFLAWSDDLVQDPSAPPPPAVADAVESCES